MIVKEIEVVIKYDSNDWYYLMELSNNSGMTLKPTFRKVFKQYFIGGHTNKLQYFTDNFYKNGNLKINSDFNDEQLLEIIVKFLDTLSLDENISKYVYFLLHLGRTLGRVGLGYRDINAGELVKRSIVQCMIETFDEVKCEQEKLDSKVKDLPNNSKDKSQIPEEEGMTNE